MENMIEGALEAGRSYGVAPGERVVLTAGVPPGISGRTNMIQVRQIPSPGDQSPA
jgi:pyruvate kinase